MAELFAADLRTQSAKVWADIATGEFSAVARIPFWSWADRQDEVMALLHPHRDETPNFLFTWPLIADVLPLCAAMVTSRGVEIRPPCRPINMIPSFHRSRRRVYARVVEAIEARFPDAATHLDGAREDLLAFSVFPHEIWRQSGATIPRSG